MQQLSMDFAVKVTSKSLIKPSSPTPLNLQQFKLSLLDKLYPSPLYPTFVLFYPATHHFKVAPTLLRHSFSTTLSHFYPLAGRIITHKDNNANNISCNDQGAVYLEAEANQDMLQFLGTSPAPNKQLLSFLAPPRPPISADMPLACVQITMFPCGGISLGICLNHIIADAHSFCLLLNHWASIFASGDNMLLANLYAHDKAASLFPPANDASSTNKSLNWEIPPDFMEEVTKANTILQRFVFKSSKMSELKSRVESSQVPNPSRTVAIFALIWKIAMKAYTMSTTEMTDLTSAAIVIVNLRSKFKQPLPDYAIGNLYWGSVSHYDTESTIENDELKRLASKLKKSIEKVDAEFTENLMGEMGHMEIEKFVQGRGIAKDYIFSSIVKMGFNQVDFGWGKPIWVCFLGQTDVIIPYGACLMEGTGYDDNENAVEAWVSLPEKEMAIFEQDPQLLQYAAVNPKII